MNDKTNFYDCRNFKVYDNDYSKSISSAIKILLAELAEINDEDQPRIYGYISTSFNWYQSSNLGNDSIPNFGLKDFDDFKLCLCQDGSADLVSGFPDSHTILVPIESVILNEIIQMDGMPIYVISLGLINKVLKRVSPSFSGVAAPDPALKN